MTKIVVRIIGFIIALGALGYRIFCGIYYYDGIAMEWGKYFITFWALFLLNIVILITPFTKGMVSLILSMIVMSASMLILCVDGIIFVAKLFDPSNRTMTEMGYLPIVYILNCIAAAFNIAGAVIDRKQDKMQNRMQNNNMYQQ